MALTTDLKAVRVPKTAELVAAHIRRQIVRGELAEGDPLPSETSLMQQLDISRPTLREAFRVLEHQGLITVRRGARGGARVHVPNHDSAARYAGLVLEHRGVTLADVFLARSIIEAPAARMLASKKPRKEIIERLEEDVAAQSQDLLNPARAPHFHRLVVEATGNQTLILLASMIEYIAEAAETSYDRANPPSMSVLRRGLRAHQRLIELIRAGRADDAEAFWRAHILEVGKWVDSTQGGRPGTVLDVLA